MGTILEEACDLFNTEINCLQETRESLGYEFQSAVISLLGISDERNKVIVIGVGKSGFIARKIAATMTSTGTKAIFLNPSEAAHGDLGVVNKNDIVIAISKSGKSQEILNIIPSLRQIGATYLISIVADEESPLAKESNKVLYTPVEKECDEYGIVPTASTTAALVLGDALAMAIMKSKNFTNKDFSKLHPGGSLGKRLIVNVEDVMMGTTCTLMGTAPLRIIVSQMSLNSFGFVCIVDSEEKLCGIITDGDLRRAIMKHCDTVGKIDVVLRAEDIMSDNPITITKDMKAYDALKLMEGRKNQISVLPVVDADNKVTGVLRLHDIIKLGI